MGELSTIRDISPLLLSDQATLVAENIALRHANKTFKLCFAPTGLVSLAISMPPVAPARWARRSRAVFSGGSASGGSCSMTSALWLRSSTRGIPVRDWAPLFGD